MPKHKKFINERICDGCRCNFLPAKGYEEVQKNCLGCAELPEIPKEENEPKQEKGVTIEQVVEVGKAALEDMAKDDSAKHTYCKKCEKEFAPTSPANKICPECK